MAKITAPFDNRRALGVIEIQPVDFGVTKVRSKFELRRLQRKDVEELSAFKISEFVKGGAGEVRPTAEGGVEEVRLAAEGGVEEVRLAAEGGAGEVRPTAEGGVGEVRRAAEGGVG